jgi:hypothetical protein
MTHLYGERDIETHPDSIHVISTRIEVESEISTPDCSISIGWLNSKLQATIYHSCFQRESCSALGKWVCAAFSQKILKGVKKQKERIEIAYQNLNTSTAD